MLFHHRLLLALATFCAAFGGGRAAEQPVGPLTLDAALADARQLSERHEGAQVWRVEGDSMLPFFGSGSVLVVKPVAPERLRPGMVVVYRNRFDETVSHRIEAADAEGWVVRGYNNDREDSTRVTAENLLGVVYATFYSNGRLGGDAALEPLLEGTAVALAAPAR